MHDGRRAAALVATLTAVLGAAGCDASDGLLGFDVADCDLFSNKLFDGGPGRDGIPALMLPDIGGAEDVPILEPTDRVLGVVQNGAARAYPFVVMWWHEVVNDTLGGEPVLVTYCPLTGSGLAFDPRVGGETLEFGVSGLIYENNLMMFDRGTASLWSQLLTSARCGPLKVTPLDLVPIVETTWERWQALYPQTTVVTTNTGIERPYGQYPYGSYDLPDNQEFFFPSSPFNITRPPKELTLGVVQGDAAVGYPFRGLYNAGDHAAVNDTVAGRPIVVLWHGPSQTAIAYDRRLDGEALAFRVSAEDPELFEDVETGSLWRQTGAAIAGPLAGRQLAPLTDSYVVFWFAWTVFQRFPRLGVE